MAVVLTLRAKIAKLLQQHQLRRTKIREDVLELFMEKQYALAHSEIEDSIGKDFDRVTIYRTLKSFEEQGLIHRVLDESGAAKYALCHHHHDVPHHHADQHIHFNCVACGRTYCLDHVPIPKVQLPADYQLRKMEFLAQGICKNCTQQASTEK
jgi:Fur family ferric uptake transcriptional regulator